MSQLASQVAIVGKKKHARSVAVESPNRIDTLGTNTLHEVHHSLTLLRIVASRNIIFGLVDEHIYLLFERYGLFVEDNFIRTEYLRSQFGNHVAVNLHHT